VRAHGLGEERHEDPVDDEPRPVRRHDDLLAELAGEVADRGLGVVGRRAAADELDQRHHRHRAEEVHPDEPRAASLADRRRQRVDRDRRGVRGKDRAGRSDRIEAAPQVRLDRLVLEHRFDDQVRVGRPAGVVGRDEALERRVALRGVQLALRDRTLEVARDPVPAGDGPPDLRLVQDDLLADRGMDLGDAVAHQAGAGDEDPLDAHPVLLGVVVTGYPAGWGTTTSRDRVARRIAAPSTATTDDARKIAG
jgi:hypothetical protein